MDELDRELRELNRERAKTGRPRLSRWELIALNAGIEDSPEIQQYDSSCRSRVGRGEPPMPIEEFVSRVRAEKLIYARGLGLGRWLDGKPPERPDPKLYRRVRDFIKTEHTVARSRLLGRYWRPKVKGLDPIIFWLVEDGLVSAEPGKIGHACHARPEVYTWIGDGPGQSESEDEGG